MEDTYSISRLAKHQISIGGASRSYEFIAKLVRDYNIQPAAESKTGTPEYRVSDLDAAYELYNQVENAGADDMQKEKLKKIKLENENLEKDSKRKDLIIEQLRNSLIDVQEMVDYWSQRKAIELAVAKKFTSIDIPMEVPGMTHAQARTKGEEYYNRLIEAYEETDRLVQEKFGLEPDKDMINKLERIIFHTFKAKQAPIPCHCQSKSGGVTEDSGSANTPVVSE
jgi:hypothetical protein